MRSGCYLLFISILLTSCSSTKSTITTVPQPEEPQWVRQTPVNNQYYHGIGSSQKIKNQDFRELARKKALAELSGNISVEISSTSILKQYQYDSEYSSFFIDFIKLSTQNDLEGYELVEEWENSQQYWVYYKLDKNRWSQTRQIRKETALSNSFNQFYEAEKLKTAGQYPNAIKFYVGALESIKSYMADDLKIVINANEEPYTSIILTKLTDIINATTVVFPSARLKIYLAQKTDNDFITIKTEMPDGASISGIPLSVHFSFFPGKIEQVVSDIRGMIRIPVGRLISRRDEEFVTASFNFASLVRSYTMDPMVRALLVNLDVPRHVLPVDVIKPLIYIGTDEEGSSISNHLVQAINLLESLLHEDGFKIGTQEESSDFFVTVKIKQPAVTEKNQVFSAEMQAFIHLRNKSGNIIWEQPVLIVSGIGRNPESASIDACQTLLGKIRILVYPALAKALP